MKKTLNLLRRSFFSANKSRPIKKGDRVQIINDETIGLVLIIDGEQPQMAEVKLGNGKITHCFLNQLIKI